MTTGNGKDRSKDRKEIPERFPAPALDQLLHLARHLHDGQLRAVLTFSGGRLDAGRLVRAFQLTLDAEPVLGCRFVAHPWRPYWERLPDDRLASPLSVAEEDNEDAVHAWLKTPLDASKDVQAHACLFRGTQEKLAVKLSHEVADAEGVLDYLGLVSNIYRELGHNPAYVPPPASERPGHEPVLRNAGFRKVVRGCLHFSGPGPGIEPSMTGERPGVPVFAARRVEPEGFSRIREYCRTHGVTVNEVILAAFHRAQYRVLAPATTAALTIPVTINLRPYLPAGSTWGVCNLSAAFFLRAKNQGFDALVTDVRRLMAEARSKTPWLAQALLLELTFLQPYALNRRLVGRLILRQIASGRIHPYVGNLGIVDTRRLDFEKAVVGDVRRYGPIPHQAVPLIGVYTVRDGLMVSITTRDRSDGREAERLLDAYVNELPVQGAV
ncbi:MAG: acyltransferase PapA5 [Syntrophorhabdaceae bacterium PtaU1.Bin034]|nr:MAG: acyltransferase PapA5 [Syntrophorhabdaceae bacterium PtaU1.Bin034]